MRLARTPLAGAQAHRIVAAAMCCAASCLPSNDLNEYSSARPAPNADDGAGEPEPPSTGAPGGGGGAGAAGAAANSPAPTAPGSGAGGSTDGAVPGGAPGPGDAGTLPTPGDAGPATSACAVGELQGANEHCYFLDAQTATWLVARSVCQARGAGWDLASVRSAADSAFLAANLTFEAWIGATDIVSEGTWTWVDDGQPFWLGDGTGAAVAGAFFNWSSTEPNGGRGSNCGRAVPRAPDDPNPDTRWADLACGQLRGAVCEAFSTP